MSYDNPRQDHGGSSEPKSAMYIDPSQAIRPDWSEVWTARNAEEQLQGFAFKGPGWYLSSTDTLLVTPCGAVEEGSTPWQWKWPEDQLFRFNVYNHRNPADGFNQIINAPVREDTRPDWVKPGALILNSPTGRIPKSTADAILAEPTGRQWIGVYVDSNEEAELFLEVLDILKEGKGLHRGVSIPSLDWDAFEPSSPEDEAWRPGTPPQPYTDEVKRQMGLDPAHNPGEVQSGDFRPGIPERAFDDTELQRQIRSAKLPKGDYDLYLLKVGPMKINVIKTLREIVPSLGLKEAKEATEMEMPVQVLYGVGQSYARRSREKLIKSGAEAKVQFKRFPRRKG
jgi:ribosomal protein L7/L12